MFMFFFIIRIKNWRFYTAQYIDNKITIDRLANHGRHQEENAASLSMLQRHLPGQGHGQSRWRIELGPVFAQVLLRARSRPENVHCVRVAGGVYWQESR